MQYITTSEYTVATLQEMYYLIFVTSITPSNTATLQYKLL